MPRAVMYASFLLVMLIAFTGAHAQSAGLPPYLDTTGYWAGSSDSNAEYLIERQGDTTLLMSTTFNSSGQPIWTSSEAEFSGDALIYSAKAEDTLPQQLGVESGQDINLTFNGTVDGTIPVATGNILSASGSVSRLNITSGGLSAAVLPDTLEAGFYFPRKGLYDKLSQFAVFVETQGKVSRITVINGMQSSAVNGSWARADLTQNNGQLQGTLNSYSVDQNGRLVANALGTISLSNTTDGLSVSHPQFGQFLLDKLTFDPSFTNLANPTNGLTTAVNGEIYNIAPDNANKRALFVEAGRAFAAYRANSTLAQQLSTATRIALVQSCQPLVSKSEPSGDVLRIMAYAFGDRAGQKQLASYLASEPTTTIPTVLSSYPNQCNFLQGYARQVGGIPALGTQASQIGVPRSAFPPGAVDSPPNHALHHRPNFLASRALPGDIEPGTGQNTCSGTTVAFINGVNTSKIGARGNLEAVKTVIGDLTDPSIGSPSAYTYKLYLNPSATEKYGILGIIADLDAVFQQKTGLFLPDAEINTIAILLSEGVVDVFNHVHITSLSNAQKVDLYNGIEAELLKIYRGIVGKVPPIALAQEFAADVHTEVASGRRVILVAHSQGNLFANMTYNLLSSTDKSAVRIAGIASPSRRQADGSIPVTRSGDTIVNKLGQITVDESQINSPPDGIPEYCTPYTQTSIGSILAFLHLTLNKPTYCEPLLHVLTQSYLDIPALRDYFGIAFVDAYNATTAAGGTYTFATVAGGAEASTQIFQIGSLDALVHISYDFYTIPDRMQVFFGGLGNPTFSTGLVNGSSQVDIDLSTISGALNSNLEVVMDEGGGLPGTAWEYTVSCQAQ